MSTTALLQRQKMQKRIIKFSSIYFFLQHVSLFMLTIQSSPTMPLALTYPSQAITLTFHIHSISTTPSHDTFTFIFPPHPLSTLTSFPPQYTHAFIHHRHPSTSCPSPPHLCRAPPIHPPSASPLHTHSISSTLHPAFFHQHHRSLHTVQLHTSARTHLFTLPPNHLSSSGPSLATFAIIHS